MPPPLSPPSLAEVKTKAVHCEEKWHDYQQRLHRVPGGLQAARAHSRGHVTPKPNRGTKNNKITDSFKSELVLNLLHAPKHP